MKAEDVFLFLSFFFWGGGKSVCILAAVFFTKSKLAHYTNLSELSDPARIKACCTDEVVLPIGTRLLKGQLWDCKNQIFGFPATSL